MTLHSTQTHLDLDSLPESTASIDVCFDDARVWSIDVRDRAPYATPLHHLRFSWPEALHPFLTGTTRVSVHDSATGVELSAREVAFDHSGSRTRVADDSGSPLVINKWGLLGTALDTMPDEVRALIVSRSAVLVEQLREFGLRPFVVGGTLLGGVRDGALLPHDDDADIAYLSEHTHPTDVAIEAFKLGHHLESLGYEIKRHSVTHMQLLFRGEGRAAPAPATAPATAPVTHYIDVFTAFFTPDGRVNQPFHVRGEMREDQMLPFSSVTIAGTAFPAPADTDRWLTINYDENWRTPIPGFQLVTPPETRRRFDGWFGAFNLHREFWDAHWEQPSRHSAPDDDTSLWEAGRAWLASSLPAPAAAPQTVVDLGCGDGALTRRLAAQLAGPVCGRAIGVDFSDMALATARSLGPGYVGRDPERDMPEPEYGHLNLYRATSLALPREHGITGAFDLVANHVLEQIGHQGRAFAWRLMRMALRSGGRARFSFHANNASNVHFEDPTGWHLTPQQVHEEAARYGLRVTLVALEKGRRKPTGAIVHLTEPRTLAADTLSGGTA